MAGALDKQDAALALQHDDGAGAPVVAGVGDGLAVPGAETQRALRCVGEGHYRVLPRFTVVCSSAGPWTDHELSAAGLVDGHGCDVVPQRIPHGRKALLSQQTLTKPQRS